MTGAFRASLGRLTFIVFIQSFSLLVSAAEISSEQNVNECVSESHSCHANTTCVNTNGSYVCTCLDMSAGHGKNCTGLCTNSFPLFTVLHRQGGFAADILLVVDESLGMETEHATLPNIVQQLEQKLMSVDIGASPLAPNRYALVGFGRSNPNPYGHFLLADDGSRFFPASKYISSNSQLQSFGSVEDGYEAIMFGINGLHFREAPRFAHVLIFLSDEDRDVLAGNEHLSLRTVKVQLKRMHFSLHVIVDHQFLAGGEVALGINGSSIKTGYVALQGDQYKSVHQDVHFGKGYRNTRRDYVYLAQRSGGSAWDISSIRNPELLDSFVNAFTTIVTNVVRGQVRNCQRCQCQKNGQLAALLCENEADQKKCNMKASSREDDSSSRANASSVDCQVSTWASWGSCSVPCGEGIKMRTRSVITSPTGNGSRCPYLEDAKDCSPQNCSHTTCEDPGAPKHGQRSYTNLKAGGTAMFTCNTGYYVWGPTRATCWTSGQWIRTPRDPFPPQCFGQKCSPGEVDFRNTGQIGHTAVDIVLVVDHSSGKVGELVLQLENKLQADGIGFSAGLQNRYGLIRFGPDNRTGDILTTSNGEQLISVRDFIQMVDNTSFVPDGSGRLKDDGYLAINMVLSEFPFRRANNIARSIILITDKDRHMTVLGQNVTLLSLKEDLDRLGIVLDVIVDNRFFAQSNTLALGVHSLGNAYVLKPGDGFFKTDIRVAIGRDRDDTRLNYVNLALDVGGTAWDIKAARSDSGFTKPFITVYVEVKINELRRQIPSCQKCYCGQDGRKVCFVMDNQRECACRLLGSKWNETAKACSVDIAIANMPSWLKVSKDQPTALQCDATGSPTPNVTWLPPEDARAYFLHEQAALSKMLSHQNRIALKPSTSPELFKASQVLHIQKTSAIHEGTYMCVAKNKFHEVVAKMDLIVIDPPRMDHPELALVRVFEGQDAHLFCNATGHPEPEITWKDQYKRVIPGETLSLLHIRNATAGNSGMYRCEARNEAGGAHRNISLHVMVAPTISDISHDVTILPGQTVDLTCTAEGDPTPAIRWARPGGKNISSRVDNILRIPNISIADNGTYTCVAQSVAGISTRTTNVIVYARPRIIGNPLAVKVFEGQNVTLYCHVKGYPTPTVQWVNPNFEVIPTGPDNVVHISSVSVKHKGGYRCTAENEGGIDRAITKLIVSVVAVNDSAQVRSAMNSQINKNLGTSVILHLSWTISVCGILIMLCLLQRTRYVTLVDLIGSPLAICWTVLLCEILLLVVIHLPGDVTSTACGVLGLLLHFFVLQIFLWLAVLVISLYRKTYKAWLRTHQIVVFAAATGTSLLLVILPVAIDGSIDPYRTSSHCTLHDGILYLVFALTPIGFLTMITIIIMLKTRLSANTILKWSGRGSTEKFALILCLLFMAVTWSLCLSFLVLEKNYAVIMFAVLNVFQGSLVVPIFSLVSINTLRNTPQVDIQQSDAFAEENVKKLPEEININNAIEMIAATMTWFLGNSAVLTKDHLQINEEIGHGQGGVVYSGLLKIQPHAPVRVAIKQLQPGGERSSAVAQSFRDEVLIMQKLPKHAHIVTLLFSGNYIDKPTMLLELMLDGDLRTFLTRKRTSDMDDDKLYTTAESIESTLSSRDLLDIGRQVVAGMAHMSSFNIVHRDLAARNILANCIDQRLVVKISDFGLARQLDNSNDIYYSEKTEMLPVLWLPLEAITEQIFSLKTDIWSFGILLWEVITMGSRPYPNIHQRDLPSLLRNGYRLLQPKHCMKEVYELMLTCWYEEPAERPTASALHSNLECLLEDEMEYLNIIGQKPTEPDCLEKQSTPTELHSLLKQSTEPDSRNELSTAQGDQAPELQIPKSTRSSSLETCLREMLTRFDQLLVVPPKVSVSENNV